MGRLVKWWMSENKKVSPESRWQRSATAVVVMMLIAFILRAALAVMHPMSFPDSRDYSALAHTILTGGAYEVRGLQATRLPGYPVYMAAIEQVFGPAPLAVQTTRRSASTTATATGAISSPLARIAGHSLVKRKPAAGPVVR